MSFLIHKMAKNTKNDSWKVSESADPNKWPVFNNPYVPKNSKPASWPTPNNWGTTTTLPPENPYAVMSEEDFKKKEKARQYRSIDDPWEVSTQNDEG